MHFRECPSVLLIFLLEYINILQPFQERSKGRYLRHILERVTLLFAARCFHVVYFILDFLIDRISFFYLFLQPTAQANIGCMKHVEDEALEQSGHRSIY